MVLKDLLVFDGQTARNSKDYFLVYKVVFEKLKTYNPFSSYGWSDLKALRIDIRKKLGKHK